MTNTDKIANSLARQWSALKSAELSDIPALAEYIAKNLEMSRLDKATLIMCMVAGYAIGVSSGILLWIACH